MINKDFFLALDELEKQKGISRQFFIETLESALVAAYKKNFGEAKAVSVKLNPEKNTIRVFAYKTVVEEVENPTRRFHLKRQKKLKNHTRLVTRFKKKLPLKILDVLPQEPQNKSSRNAFAKQKEAQLFLNLKRKLISSLPVLSEELKMKLCIANLPLRRLKAF